MTSIPTIPTISKILYVLAACYRPSMFTRTFAGPDSLAVQLQNEALESLIKMWIELLMAVAAKIAALV